MTHQDSLGLKDHCIIYLKKYLSFLFVILALLLHGVFFITFTMNEYLSWSMHKIFLSKQRS
jgi:hypothetical protein